MEDEIMQEDQEDSTDVEDTTLYSDYFWGS
jgi:hypothetical protein